MSEVVLAAHGDGLLATDLRSGALVASYEDAGAVGTAFGCVDSGAGHIYAVQASKALWQVWDWGAKRPSYRASLPEKITAMAFSQDSSFCFAGAVSGMVYVWLQSTGALLRSWPAHFREVTQMLVSSDGGFLVTASADSAVHVYNMADVFSEHQAPKPFHAWSGHSLAVTCLTFFGPSSALEGQVATGSLDRSVRLWDVGTGRLLQSRTLGSQVLGLAAGPAGSELVVAGEELRSLGADLTKDLGRFEGHQGPVRGCAVSLDGSRVASCGDADKVRVWEVRTRQCLAQLHSNREVRISGVKILQRSPLPPVPPFQPFQRVLTSPEDLAPVPRCFSGREAALKKRMAPYTRAEELLDQVQMAAAFAPSAQGPEVEASLSQQLAEARQSEARWAKVATQLYELVQEHGLDKA